MNLDLDKLEELCTKATRGPWEWKINHNSARLVGEFLVMSCGGGMEWDQYKGEEPEKADAQFIAEARSALPALIARVREAEKLLKDVQDYFDNPQKYEGTWPEFYSAVIKKHLANKEVRQDG